MPDLKATRVGNKVLLPKYVNAEMLMLEFFAGVEVVIEPMRSNTHTIVFLSHVDGRISGKKLDGLLHYINLNI